MKTSNQNVNRREKSHPMQLKTELHERIVENTRKRNKEWGSPALPRGNKKEKTTNNPEVSRCPHTNQRTDWSYRAKLKPTVCVRCSAMRCGQRKKPWYRYRHGEAQWLLSQTCIHISSTIPSWVIWASDLTSLSSSCLSCQRSFIIVSHWATVMIHFFKCKVLST